jgi:hypothetical protein
MSTERRIQNISEYIEIIQHDLSTNRALWFRGHNDMKWQLKPSIARDYDMEKEKRMTDEFRWKAKSRYHKVPHDDNYPEWLCLMQHFGLPTRLLDWSASPLIALYFAMYDDGSIYLGNEDACVWILNPCLLNKDTKNLEQILSLDYDYCRALIQPAFTNSKGTSPNRSMILAASSTEIDNRMLVQQSAFTIHGQHLNLNGYKNSESYLSRIIIPCEYRNKISNELKSLGFTPSMLFPDLRHLCQELKLKYK